MLLLLFLLAVAVIPAAAQYDLAGVVDFHAHSDPDSVPRSLDALEVAELARRNGLRGIVLKNHWTSTAGLAYLVSRRVPGIEVYGGIALNLAVGGVNPEAVERMARTRGGHGRVVWLPTFDVDKIPLERDGELTTEVKRVIEIIERDRLVLETGHTNPATGLKVIRAARAAGVRSIIVTHAIKPPINMSIEQMKEAASLGAFIEFDYGGTLPSPIVVGQRVLSIDEYARAIRAVGPQHCILTSDLGQAGNPIHTDGFRLLAEALMKRGFSVTEIDLMMKKNPAQLLLR